MQKLFKWRLLKLQRLIHLSLEQEKQRLLETWRYWGYVLQLAAFQPVEELAHHVADPQLFRDEAKTIVLAMSDQMPF